MKSLRLLPVLFLLVVPLAVPTSASAVTPHPLRQGLVATRDVTGTNAVVDHVIIHTNWSDLESADQSWTSQWTTVKNMVINNPNIKFAWRIFAGMNSPQFVKNLSGGCVNVTNPQSGVTGCVPRFWTLAVQAEYNELMDHVAAVFPSNPRMEDVVNTACTTINAENFIIGNDSASIDRLANAGLGEQGARDCFNNTMAHQQAVLAPVGIRTSTATHTKWQIVVPDAGGGGHLELSWEKERAILNNWSTTYSANLIVQNNGLGAADFCSPGEPLDTASGLYCWMATRGYRGPAPDLPTGFQLTEPDPSLKDDAVRNAINMGGCFVESAVGVLNNLSGRDSLDAALQANCP